METTVANQLQKIQENQKGLIVSNIEKLSNLTQAEQKVIELKYASKRFNKLSPEELEVTAAGLLIKISYITGWVMPVDDEHMDVLEDQFRKKLTESYANTNTEEVEYAFRNYGTLVKDWGKQMNLSLIDEVMNPYLMQRLELSKIEEQVKKELPPPTENLSDQTMMEWIEETKKELNAGNIKSIYFLPVMQYEWLVKEGKLNPTNQEKREALVKAQGYRQTELMEAAQGGGREDAERLGNFTQMKLDGFVGAEKDLLTSLAKRILLFDYLKQ